MQLAALGKMRTHARAPAELLGEPLQHVGALQVLVMLVRQSIERQVLPMFSSTHSVSFGYLRCQRVSQPAKSCCASATLRRA